MFRLTIGETFKWCLRLNKNTLQNGGLYRLFGLGFKFVVNGDEGC